MNVRTRLIIGTAEDCQLQVMLDPYVSAHHCEVVQLDTGQCLVRDLGSTNGTRLKSFTIQPGKDSVIADATAMQVRDWTPIAPGMVLVVGHTEIPWSRSR